MQEREIQHAIRLALGDEPDLVLFRNTVGAALDLMRSKGAFVAEVSSVEEARRALEQARV